MDQPDSGSFQDDEDQEEQLDHEHDQEDDQEDEEFGSKRLEAKLVSDGWDPHGTTTNNNNNFNSANSTTSDNDLVDDEAEQQIASWKSRFAPKSLFATSQEQKQPSRHVARDQDTPPSSNDAELSYTWKRADGTIRHHSNGNAQDQEDGEEEEEENQPLDANTTKRVKSSDSANQDDDTDTTNDDNHHHLLQNENYPPQYRPIASGIDELPLFADAKNKKLHRQIRQKESQFQKVTLEIHENVSRVEIMKEHLKNVQQELLHTQELQVAKTKEIDSEVHLRQLRQREIGRLQQEIDHMDRLQKEFDAKLSTLQNFLFVGNEKMDQFKLQMNWNQEEMEQWAMASRQKEEDFLQLEKYRRVDEVRIKELTLQIEKLTNLINQQSKQIDQEATEAQAKQIEIEKTFEEFKNSHDQRQQLVNQWQETIDTMTKRDQEIAKASEVFAQLKLQLNDKKTALQQQQQRFKAATQANVDMQNTIHAKERQQSKIQLEKQSFVQQMENFHDQVEILKNQLANVVNVLMSQRSVNNSKQQQLESLKNDLEAARQRYKLTQKNLEKWTTTTLSAEEMAKVAEQQLQDKDNESTRLEKDISVQKDIMFKKSQQLFSLRQKEAALIAEISGAKAASVNLKTKIKTLDGQILRQQELLYNGEFQIQQMERKVARASGERSAEETKVLQQQIATLQLEHDRVVAQQDMLVAQCKKIDQERKTQERLLVSLQAQQRENNEAIDKFQLANQALQFALKQQLKQKEEHLVTFDLQSVEIQRLKRVLNDKTDQVFSLENQEFQLKKSLEEKKKTIQVHQEIQKQQNKLRSEEKHQVSLELAERMQKVGKLQAKFEALCKKTGYEQEPGGGADAASAGAGGGIADGSGNGESRTQAYFVIKAAQRREELQREGDELDEQIRVAEKDVRALRKTLDHVEDRNSSYRKSFHQVQGHDEHVVQLQSAENALKQVKEQLFQKKKELLRLDNDLEQETNKLNEVTRQLQFAKDNGQHLTSAWNQIQKDLVSQRAKASNVHKRIQKNLRGSGSGTVGIKQLQMQTWNNKEIAQSLLFTLGQLANEFPEISELLQNEIQSHGLHIPAIPPGRTAAARAAIDPTANFNSEGSSSRPGSARSDRSDKSVKSAASSASNRSGASSSTGSARLVAPLARVQLDL